MSGRSWAPRRSTRWTRECSSDSESDSDPETAAENDVELASAMLIEYMLVLYFGGKLSAKGVCVCFMLLGEIGWVQIRISGSILAQAVITDRALSKKT